MYVYDNLHTNSYMPSLNYSSLIADKLKSKYCMHFTQPLGCCAFYKTSRP